MIYSHRYSLHQYLITNGKKEFLQLDLANLGHSYKAYGQDQAISSTWFQRDTPRDLIRELFGAKR